MLATRQHLALSVAKDRNPPYMVLSDGTLRNAYTVKLRNMEDRPRKFALDLTGPAGAVMWSDDMARAGAARRLVRDVAADQTDPLRIYVSAPAGTHQAPISFTITALDAEGGRTSTANRFDTPDTSQ